jgi:hypothetical protein
VKTLAPTDLSFFETAPLRIVASARVSASPARVFESFAKPEDWPKWFPMMKYAKWTKGEGGLDSEREVSVGALGKYRERMIAWEPGARFSFTMIGSTSPLAEQLAEDYLLVPDGTGTVIEWVMAGRPTTVGKLGAPVMKAIMSRLFAKGGRNLEALLK